MESCNKGEKNLEAMSTDIEYYQKKYLEALSNYSKDSSYETLLIVFNKLMLLTNKLNEELQFSHHYMQEAFAYTKQMAASFEAVSKNNIRLEDSLCSMIELNDIL